MAGLYRFGRFTLDPVEHRLCADGAPVPLGPTDFRLLLALVESAGAIVAKDHLMSLVGGARDNVLHVHISALRKVVGNDCIVSQQGRGYRFVAAVEQREQRATEGPARLIGRSEQLRRVSELLAHARLVTLTGPGGVGKTTLALHVVGEANFQSGVWRDGVWLVELANLSDPESVPGSIAAALGVQVGVNAAPLDTLTRHLARKSLLIVLDNCENVLAAAAHIAEALLAAAPGVKILATSREPLSCSGEQVLDVPPLALPHDGTMPPDQMRSMAAVELFIERVTEADANFRIDDSELALAAKICRRVDGLPLAIEMVAGWACVLGLETLDAKLDGSLKDWLHARSTAPSRHATLRATLEWSHALLSPAEQAVLCRLAVFAGGFTMEAAEAVAHRETGSAAFQAASAERAGWKPALPVRLPVFEHVASLVRKSMIAVVPGSRPRRYRLLETTRDFMLEELEASGNGNATRRLHAHYVLRVLEEAKLEWETTSDTIWAQRYGPLLDDLRAAFDWAMGEESDDAVALAGASFPLFRESSLGAEARKRLTAAATRLGPSTPPALEARLRHGLGVTLLNTPAMNEAHEELDRTANLYRKLGDTTYLGSSLIALGYSLFMLDRIGEAEQAIAEALNLLEGSGWLRTLATAWYVKMHIEAALGRFDAADAARENAARLCEMAGADRVALNLSVDWVQVALQKGDVEGAIGAARSAAQRLRDTLHSDLCGFALGVLAAALTERGDLDEALTAACEAAPLLRDDGRLFWLFDHLALRAALARRAKDAALIAGYADAVHQKFGRPREPIGRGAVKRTNLLLREALPEEEITRLARLGAQLSEDQALSVALV